MNRALVSLVLMVATLAVGCAAHKLPAHSAPPPIATPSRGTVTLSGIAEDAQVVDTPKYMTCIGAWTCKTDITCEVDVTSMDAIEGYGYVETVQRIQGARLAIENCADDPKRQEVLDRLLEHRADLWWDFYAKKNNSTR